MKDLYREVILAHYRSPVHRGTMPNATVQMSTNNPLCGDELTVFARVEGDQLVEGAYDAVGCSIVHASADMMVDLVEGRSLDDVSRLAGAFHELLEGESEHPATDLGEAEVLREVRKFPVRVRCALLPWNALQDALSQTTDN